MATTTTTISGLTALGAAPATTDLFVAVDVSDPSQAPSGTTKKLTVTNLFTTPTMTAPVITGGLTVSAGGAAITGTVTITGAATVSAGLTVSSGGVTITAGGLTVTAGTTAVQALSATTGLFTGAVTVGAQLNANGGIVVSAGTFASNAIVVHPSYGLVLGASSGTIYSFGIFTSAALPILAVPTGTRDIAISGAATVTGLMTANAGIAVAGGAFVPGNIYKSATSGTSIACQTGSAYDFAVPNVAGTLNVMAVPTGTNNITFFGLISAAGLPTSAGASGTLYVDGSGFVKRA